MTFEDRNVRSDPDYLKELMDLGARATPVTVVDDDGTKQTVIGFQKDKLAKLLGL